MQTILEWLKKNNACVEGYMVRVDEVEDGISTDYYVEYEEKCSE